MIHKPSPVPPQSKDYIKINKLSIKAGAYTTLKHKEFLKDLDIKKQFKYSMKNRYIDLPEEELTGDYDIAFAEIGILHYFTDLHPLFTTAYCLLKKGGTFVLRDFHPVSNKLITSRGTTAKIRKHKVTGDYFSKELVESEISFAKYMPDAPTQKVYLRKWNLGEIITAIADVGFHIESLDEEPNMSCEQYDKGIPKTFTLKVTKL